MPFSVEALLEGLDVVGAEGDVAALDGIDGLTGAEADAEILLGQMELRDAVAQERDLAGIAVLVEDAAPSQATARAAGRAPRDRTSSSPARPWNRR